MGKETKFYVLDWGNGMIGIFKGSNLSQISNNTKNMFSWTLQHCMSLYSMKECTIEFLNSREELQKMREERGIEKKPTLDEYLKQQGYNFKK